MAKPPTNHPPLPLHPELAPYFAEIRYKGNFSDKIYYFTPFSLPTPEHLTPSYALIILKIISKFAFEKWQMGSMERKLWEKLQGGFGEILSL